MTTPADTLTSTQWSGVVDVASATPAAGLTFTLYDAVSDDPAIASIESGPSDGIAVFARGAGTCSVTVTRKSDSEESIIAVTVTETSPGVFEAHLGNAVEK